MLNLIFTKAYAIGEGISVPGNRVDFNEVEDLFNAMVPELLWTAGVLAVIAVIATGILLAAAWGQPEKMVQAKKNFLWAILGMIVIIFSFVIISGIRQTLQSGSAPPSTPTPPTVPPSLPNPPGGGIPTPPTVPPSLPSTP